MSENAIDPNDLTSPGTVDDPALEEQEAERSHAAQVVADVPEPQE